MQRLLLIGSFIFLVSMLSGCGPMYETQYKYIPPASNIGKMCTSQCVQSKSMCQQMCEMRKQSCRRGERVRSGKKDDRKFDYLEPNCDNIACDCTETFNTCYGACGGEVLERQVCVAFC